MNTYLWARAVQFSIIFVISYLLNVSIQVIFKRIVTPEKAIEFLVTNQL